MPGRSRGHPGVMDGYWKSATLSLVTIGRAGVDIRLHGLTLHRLVDGVDAELAHLRRELGDGGVLGAGCDRGDLIRRCVEADDDDVRPGPAGVLDRLERADDRAARTRRRWP